MKILIITAPNYDDTEVLYPYYRLLEAGLEPEVASFDKGMVAGKYHFTIPSNVRLEELELSQYSGLYLPGGSAPEKLRLNASALEAVKWFMGKELPVASICHGQQLLISAGVLQGKRATCYPGIRDDLKNAGAIYENAPVVVDGCLVTSRRPEDLPWLMREYMKLFE